jgi:hypothetical protein
MSADPRIAQPTSLKRVRDDEAAGTDAVTRTPKRVRVDHTGTLAALRAELDVKELELKDAYSKRNEIDHWLTRFNQCNYGPAFHTDGTEKPGYTERKKKEAALSVAKQRVRDLKPTVVSLRQEVRRYKRRQQ